MGIYWQLFTSFFKIGLFTFGGGYAMLPLIQKEMISHKWATEKEILNYYALSQVTPGIIAVNVSTFIGYKIRGFLGALCTLLGVISPSLLIISILALSLSEIWHMQWIKNAFWGIQLMIPALIIPIVVRMIKNGSKTALGIFVMIFAFTLRFLGCSPILILLLSAFISYLYFEVKKDKK